jgi:hypothetical protein
MDGFVSLDQRDQMLESVTFRGAWLWFLIEIAAHGAQGCFVFAFSEERHACLGLFLKNSGTQYGIHPGLPACATGPQGSEDVGVQAQLDGLLGGRRDTAGRPAAAGEDLIRRMDAGRLAALGLADGLQQVVFEFLDFRIHWRLDRGQNLLYPQ